MRLLVLNGPNLDMLGIRNPDVYGTQSLDDLYRIIEARAQQLDVDVRFLQSNHEGVLIDALHEAHFTEDAVIYNPGAHAHYSYALRDAVEAISKPVYEVHISDTLQREAFRHVDVIGEVCVRCFAGHGLHGYIEALDFAVAQRCQLD